MALGTWARNAFSSCKLWSQRRAWLASAAVSALGPLSSFALLAEELAPLLPLRAVGVAAVAAAACATADGGGSKAMATRR
jgi:hypothetical protein